MRTNTQVTRAIVLVIAFLLYEATSLKADQPPNIVVILADDLGCCDMALYDGWVKTPNLARMAKQGMLFTDFHTNSSVCSPTRAAFLTGRYQQRVGIVDVIVGNRLVPFHQIRIAPLQNLAILHSPPVS